jgi:hypothetical protein
MPAFEGRRLIYGHRKYASLHLMYARLIRLAARHDANYVYVTLGGTEFRDVQCLRFIDSRLAVRIISFESDKTRHSLASETANKLRAQGVPLTLFNASFFDYERTERLPHIFFLDLEGICAPWGGYDEKLGQMFQDEAIREGDLLLITSSLGRDLGIKEIMATFYGEYSVLNITEQDDARRAYRRSHPSFTLYKGLNEKGLTGELRVRCLGCIKYRDPDRSPMGIYGYSILEGSTDFRQFINDSEIQYYDMNEICRCGATDW